MYVLVHKRKVHLPCQRKEKIGEHTHLHPKSCTRNLRIEIKPRYRPFTAWQTLSSTGRGLWARSAARTPDREDACCPFAVSCVRNVRAPQEAGTYLLQQVINLEVHLKDGPLTSFVVQRNDERSRRGGGDVEVDVRSPITAGQKRPSKKVDRHHLLSGTLLSTMMPSFSNWACVNL